LAPWQAGESCINILEIHDGRLYAACQDNSVRCFDEHGLVHSFECLADEKHSVYDTLLAHARSGNPELQLQAAIKIAVLGTNRQAMVAEGGIPVMLELLLAPDPEVPMKFVQTLFHVTVEEPEAVLACDDVLSYFRRALLDREPSNAVEYRVRQWAICCIRGLSAHGNASYGGRLLLTEQKEQVWGMLSKALSNTASELKNQKKICDGEKAFEYAWDLVNQGIAALWNLAVVDEFAQFQLEHGVEELIRTIGACADPPPTEFASGLSRALDRAR